MADHDMFGEAALFGEFDRERDVMSSRLYTQIGENESSFNSQYLDSAEPPPKFDLESSDESIDVNDTSGFDGIDDDEKQTNKIENATKDSEQNIQNGSSESDTVLKKQFLSMKRKISVLETQNQRLTKIARLSEVSQNMIQEDGPGFIINFLNNRIARKYKADIENFISNLTTQDDEDNDDLPTLNIRSHYLCVADEKALSENADNLNDIKKSHTVIASCQYFKNFIADVTGWPLVGDHPSLTDSWEIPIYEQKFYQSLPYVEDEEDDLDKPSQKRDNRGPCCFNCDGKHSLKDCKERKDFARINIARQEFMDKFSPRTISGRGYKDLRNSAPDLKFNKFKPGTISSDLRNALGIRDNSLPPYIYQMRVWGYPPGHLQSAEISHSGFTMFDKHGRETNKDGEALEDGEVDTDRYADIAFDLNSIVEYPGFNVPAPSEVIDEYAALNMPQMIPYQQRDALTEVMGDSMFKKISKPSRRNKTATTKVDREEQDMDLDSSDNELGEPTDQAENHITLSPQLQPPETDVGTFRVEDTMYLAHDEANLSQCYMDGSHDGTSLIAFNKYCDSIHSNSNSPSISLNLLNTKFDCYLNFSPEPFIPSDLSPKPFLFQSPALSPIPSDSSNFTPLPLDPLEQYSYVISESPHSLTLTTNPPESPPLSQLLPDPPHSPPLPPDPSDPPHSPPLPPVPPDPPLPPVEPPHSPPLPPVPSDPPHCPSLPLIPFDPPHCPPLPLIPSDPPLPPVPSDPPPSTFANLEPFLIIPNIKSSFSLEPCCDYFGFTGCSVRFIPLPPTNRGRLSCKSQPNLSDHELAEPTLVPSIKCGKRQVTQYSDILRQCRYASYSAEAESLFVSKFPATKHQENHNLINFQTCNVPFDPSDSHSIYVGEPQKPIHRQLSRVMDSSSASSSPASTPRRSQSITLDDLEEQRQLLLSQLADEEGVTSTDDIEPRIMDEYYEGDPDPVPAKTSTPTRNKDEPLLYSPFETPTSQVMFSRCDSISCDLGTPVISECNQQIKLPSPEKWAQNIAEHDTFVNLADSNGMFQKMRLVINNVRKYTNKPRL